MESGSHSAGKYDVRLYARILTTLLCFILVLFSFIFMDANSHAAGPKQRLDQMATSTLTSINTATATSTSTPTPTATNTPTPTPIATNTPRPTPTETKPRRRTPTATATVAAAVIPTATATSVRVTPTVGKAIVSTSTGQTPTSAPVESATTTLNDTGNRSSTAGQQGIDFFPFVTGALLLVGIVIVLGFLLLRKNLLPPQPVKVNLPPSGAQPWRRIRTDSLHGNTNIAVDPLQDSVPTLIVPVMTSSSSEPATEKIKLMTRRGTRLVKMEKT